MLLSLLIFFSAASAQSVPPPATLAPTTSIAIPVVTHSVAVGADGFKFTPNQVDDASVGDVIEFRFYPGGHTVVRAEFQFPCIPFEYTGPNKVGFFSGQMSPQVISNDLPAFRLRVNDTRPIFFYCSAPGSCIKEHMIGVVNPSANQSLAAQAAFARNASYQLAPGDPFPTESGGPTASPSPVADKSQSAQLGGGAIAGIAIGCAAVLGLVGALVYLCGWRFGMGSDSKNDSARDQTSAPSPPPPPPQQEPSSQPGSPATAGTTNKTGHAGASPLVTPSTPGPDYQAPPYSPHALYYLPSSSPAHLPLSSYILYPGSESPVAAPAACASDDAAAKYPPEQPEPVELPVSPHPLRSSPVSMYRESRYSWQEGEQQLPEGKS